MSLQDSRTAVFEFILGEISRLRQHGRPFVVGITGIDGAGKSHFAAALEQFLNERGYETQSIALDDFHNLRAYRYAGDDQADNYYNRSFAIGTIVDSLLGPLHRAGSFETLLSLLDLETDTYDISRTYFFRSDTIVIFEGVFIFRPEFMPYIDYGIFLEIPFDESKRRALLRKPGLGPEDLRQYDLKYLPAQRKYLGEYPPEKTANLIIDNLDWDRPRLVRRP